MTFGALKDVSEMTVEELQIRVTDLEDALGLTAAASLAVAAGFLTQQQAACLSMLLTRSPKIVPKQALAMALPRIDVSEPMSAHQVGVIICKLRRKLSQIGLCDQIETVWGEGYVISAEAAARIKQEVGL